MKRYHTRLASILLICLMGSRTWAAEPSDRQAAKPARPILEPIEWTDIWVTDANKDDLPRVLFVGDSIVRGYFGRTEKELTGVAHCARYATSAFLAQQDYLDSLKILLRRYHFAVIHINNGLHGWGYTEEQYRQGFPPLIRLLEQYAPDATIIWATTTPVRQRGHVEKLKVESTERVRARNRIAAAFVKRHTFLTSDLFSLVIDHPEYYREDGVHFNARGVAAQAEYVAGLVRQALKSRQHR